jgi:hypothetical protein
MEVIFHEAQDCLPLTGRLGISDDSLHQAFDFVVADVQTLKIFRAEESVADEAGE